MTTLYLAHQGTLEYVSNRELTDLDRNPKFAPKTHDPADEFIYNPRLSSLSRPPAAEGNKTPVLSDGDWLLVDDYRDIDYWDTETLEKKTISALGDTPETGWTELEPEPGQIWDNSAGAWIDDAVEQWKIAIAATDVDMPRAIEDIWDVIGISTASTYVQEIYANKKDIRAQQPVE